MSPNTHNMDSLRHGIIQRLQSLQRAGVEQIPHIKINLSPRDQTTTEIPPTAPQETNPDLPSANHTSTTSTYTISPPETSSNDRISALEIIRHDVTGCTRCGELARTRTQTVFGVGNPNTRICFLGEAPGADEDRQGEPFVGRAGKLLTDIIQKGMGLQREDIFILNVLKCRPPGNRNPLPEEVENCRGFFERQLDVLQPEIICCLGAVAAQNLLQTSEPIGRLRGRFHDYRGIKVLATYHPAYLLRNPSAKKNTWEDIQLLMQELGMPLPDKKI